MKSLLNVRTRSGLFRLRLCLLAWAGIILRLIVARQLVNFDPAVTRPSPVTDMATYHALSVQILSGQFPQTFYYQPFYYSVFLPVAKFLFRSDVWGPILVQSLCAGGIIYLAGLCGAMLRSRRTGYFAALLATFSSLLVFYVPYALIEIQQCFWFTLLFYLTLRALKTNRMRYWGAAGIVLAFAVLSRGNALCFIPPILLVMFYAWRRVRSWKRTLANAGVFLLCLLLPQLPFILHNSLALGHLSGPSTAGPAVLALGNTPEAPPGGLTYPPTYEYWMNSQTERSVPGRILDWALSEPGAFLELQFRKFLLFWDRCDIPNNIDLEVNGAKSGFLPYAGFIPTGFILMLALAGLFLTMKKLLRHQRLQLLWLFILFYALAAAAFYILGRFRLPALGLFCIAGGIFPDALLQTLRKRDWHSFALRKIPAMLGGCIIVFFANDSYRYGYEASMMRLVRPNGSALVMPNQVELFDYGPMLQGGWQGLPLEDKLTFIKKFEPKPELLDVVKRGKEIRLQFHFAFSAPALLALEINGVEQTIDLRNAQTLSNPLVVITDPLPIQGDLTFFIKIQKVISNGQAAVLFDLQRNYGRTLAGDGKPLPAEMAVRLISVSGK